MQDNPDRWDRFTAFLSEANRNTYANENALEAAPLRPGWKHYHFESSNFPEFAYDDEYAGSTRFLGEEVIAENGKIIWGMNYYGGVIAKDLSEKEIYHFLRIALMGIGETKFARISMTRNGEPVVPVRGPSAFVEGDWTYRFRSNGDIKSFDGAEDVLFKDRRIYEAFVRGGIVF